VFSRGPWLLKDSAAALILSSLFAILFSFVWCPLGGRGLIRLFPRSPFFHFSRFSFRFLAFFGGLRSVESAAVPFFFSRLRRKAARP
jgi:hypothetical protein